jgi:hypothetical protein
MGLWVITEYEAVHAFHPCRDFGYQGIPMPSQERKTSGFALTVDYVGAYSQLRSVHFVYRADPKKVTGQTVLAV